VLKKAKTAYAAFLTLALLIYKKKPHILYALAPSATFLVRMLPFL
jgi:hypothetical protein